MESNLLLEGYEIGKLDKLELPKEFWGNLSKDKNLTEEIIRIYKDKLDWYLISQYQKLSEDFIIEFHDKVNWEYIAYYQKLSAKFIVENWDRLYIYLMAMDVPYKEIVNDPELHKRFLLKL